MKLLDKFKALFFQSNRLSNVEFTAGSLPLFREAIVGYLSAQTKGAIIVDDDEIVLRGLDGRICLIKFCDPDMLSHILAIMKGKPA